MKIVLKIFSVIITAVILCSCGKVPDKISEEIPDMTLGEQTLEQLDIQSVTEASDKQYTPVNFDIQKAMWLTMMDYEYLLKDRTKQEFTDNIKKAYEDMISDSTSQFQLRFDVMAVACQIDALKEGAAYLTNLDKYTKINDMLGVIDQVGMNGSTLLYEALNNKAKIDESNILANLPRAYYISSWYRLLSSENTTIEDTVAKECQRVCAIYDAYLSTFSSTDELARTILSVPEYRADVLAANLDSNNASIVKNLESLLQSSGTKKIETDAYLALAYDSIKKK